MEIRGETREEHKPQKRADRKAPTFRVIRRVPEGLTAEQARQRAAEALVEFVTEEAER